MSVDNIFLARVPSAEVNNIRIIATYMCDLLCNTLYSEAKGIMVNNAVSATKGAKISYSLHDSYRELISATAHALINSKTKGERYASYLTGLYAYYGKTNASFQSIDSFILAIGMIFVPEAVYIKMADADRKTTVMVALSRAYADMCRYVAEPAVLNNLIDDRKNPAHMLACASKAIEVLVLTRETTRSNWVTGGSSMQTEGLQSKITNKLRQLLSEKLALERENHGLYVIIEKLEDRIKRLEMEANGVTMDRLRGTDDRPQGTDDRRNRDDGRNRNGDGRDDKDGDGRRDGGASRHVDESRQEDELKAIAARKARIATDYNLRTVSFTTPSDDIANLSSSSSSASSSSSELPSVSSFSLPPMPDVSSKPPVDEVISLTDTSINKDGDEVLHISTDGGAKSRVRNTSTRGPKRGDSSGRSTHLVAEESGHSTGRSKKPSKKPSRHSSDSDDEPSDIDDN